MSNIIARKVRVLFFGRHGCAYSQQTQEYLKHLGFDVLTVWSISRDEVLPESVSLWDGEYIICFRSYFILPASLIQKASIAAINFHPGPTEYPGSGCVNWALYEGSRVYGATAHIMSERIDDGAVLECRRFPILPQDDVPALLARAHHKAYDLIIDFSTGLALEGEQFIFKKLSLSRNEKWVGPIRAMSSIDRLQNVDISCTEQELERVIRATYTEEFRPFIQLHGYRFLLMTEN